MARMSPPTLDEKVVPVLGPDALGKLRSDCSGDRFEDLRDSAIMAFLLDTGARLAELVALRTVDVDCKAGAALVTGKGRRERRVYFTPATALAMDRYYARAARSTRRRPTLRSGWATRVP